MGVFLMRMVVRSFWRVFFAIGGTTVLALLALGAVPSASSQNAFVVLYSGNRHSELEPCGCHAKQLGGIDLEAHYIEDVEEQNTPVIHVDSGGFIDPFLSANERLKSEFVLRIMELMQFQAVNVSEQDLKMGPELLVSLKNQNKLPLVSANILDKNSGAPLFDQYRVVKVPMGKGQESLTVGIVGVTYSVASTYRRVAAATPTPVRPAVNEQAKPEVQGRFEGGPGWQLQFQYGPNVPASTPGEPHRGQVNLVRPSLSGRPPQTVSNEPQRVVRSQETTYRPPVPPPNISNTVPARRPAAVPRSLGRETYQGPVRGSSSETSGQSAPYNIVDPAQALSQVMPELRKKCDIVMVLSHLGLMGSKQLAHQVSGIDIVISGAPSAIQFHPVQENGALLVHPGFGGRYLGKLVVETDQNRRISKAIGENIEIADPIKPDPEITKLIDEYKTETRKLQPPPRAPKVQITFAGAPQCRACHEQQYTSWEATRHAHAIQTLITKKQQFNPDCLQCHTTGYMQDNGFRDLRTSPAMANVQCEVCHSAAYKHVIEQRIFDQQKKRTPATTASTLRFTPRNTPKAEVSPALCLKCHTEENDDDFNFERDLKLISHKQQSPAP